MKIKILKSSGWYKGYIETEFEVDGYHLTSSADLRFSVFNHGWIYSCDCVITKLPESFCVKRCDDNNRDDWNKYLQWLNKQKNYPIPMFGGVDRYKYYGVNGENLHSDYLYPFGTEIHIDDMIKHIDYMETKDSITVKYENGKFIEVKEEFNMNTVDGRLAYAKKHYPIGCTVIEVSGEKFKSKVKEILTSVNNSIKLQFGAGLLYNNITGEWAEIIKEEKNMETQKLSRQGLKEIHSVACSSWRGKLEGMGIRNPLEDYIELTQEEVDIMFNACTKEQLPIVSKYLKQDDGSVDIMKFKCEIYDKDGRAVIEKRFDGEYGHKSLLLDDVYDWDIKTDSMGKLCLIPTKKK